MKGNMSASHRLKISCPELDVNADRWPGLPNVFGGPSRLDQVLANVLENAGEDGSPAAVQAVAALQPGRQDVVEIPVSDKRNRIAPGNLPYISEKFFRAANGRQDRPGLGLWISKQIVEAPGGELVAGSVPGESTTVRFTIPLHHGPAAGKLAGK
jgi:signal transduction histidine kinase